MPKSMIMWYVYETKHLFETIIHHTESNSKEGSGFTQQLRALFASKGDMQQARVLLICRRCKCTPRHWVPLCTFIRDSIKGNKNLKEPD
ncbi:hypothetical protein JHK85_006715 [Glycine max]|nr:hypothetical protein JHK85_006715 [Glycine max]